MRGWQRAVLVTVAVAATFGIGILVGREIARPPARPPAEPSMRYDLGPFAEVKPELLAYRLMLTIPVSLGVPRGIASLADGTVYVCGDRALVAIDRSGAVESRWDLDGEPTCVAAGAGGRVYVGMRDHVEVIEAGAGVRQWPDLGSQAIVTSIAVSGGSVFVADAGNRMVLRFDGAGKLTGTVGADFVVPSPFFDVSASTDGSLFVADPGNQRIRRYGADGRLLAQWGRASLDIDGFGGCCNPAHIAVLPCGALVTSEKGLPRVKVYEPDGTLTAVVAPSSDFGAAETGLDLATRQANGGEVLVLVPGERAVRVYVKKGAGSG